jgi:hypothetical protein
MFEESESKKKKVKDFLPTYQKKESESKKECRHS